ncbi:ethanolamine permease [Ravibacter arvi]|uniref:Ethanolamine permease n=2 Tax=Ravibacter arvi TaxID=2051041 RepID=A0ABP8LY32_9BACT
MAATNDAPDALKKVLKPIHLWAIAVGLVISGDYFGWNYGWSTAGTIGFLIATVIITILYVTFIFSFTELTTMIPQAGGPFSYAERALGPFWGLAAGYATLIEFLLAPPAIAFALGSYIHFLYPGIPVLSSAIASYVIFTIINFLGVKESATFTLFITLLAVGELFLYMGIVAPHFEIGNFTQDAFPLSWSGIFAAIPFAIWFYLAIEGVAMVAEEVDEPRKNIPKGYIYGILTLVFLALGVMILTGGATDWKQLSNLDYPLPETIGQVLGKDNPLTKVFASIGLFGLIASFHSIMFGYSREIFAMARAGYLPKVLARLHPRFKTPHWALVAGGAIGFISLLTGTTGQVITLSAIGAVAMYIISMVSLFVLRKKAPHADRPFTAPLYPWFPAIALVLSVFSFIAIAWFNPLEVSIFIAMLVTFLLGYKVFGRREG